MILIAALLFTLWSVAACAANLKLASDSADILRKEGGTLRTMTVTVLASVIEPLDRYNRNGIPFHLGSGLYPATCAHTALRSIFLFKAARHIAAPAIVGLEQRIRFLSQGGFRPGSRNALHASLKAYLSISDARGTAALLPEDIAPEIASAIQSVQKTDAGISATTLFLYSLRNKSFPTISADSMLIASAREKLSTAPDPENMCETILLELQQRCDSLRAEELINIQNGIFTSTKQLSRLYTQEGFKQLVAPALREAANHPSRADWVSGRMQIADNRIDRKALQNDLVKCYMTAANEAWNTFLGGISVHTPINTADCNATLQGLTAPEGELTRLVLGIQTAFPDTANADARNMKGIGIIKSLIHKQSPDSRNGASCLAAFANGDPSGGFPQFIADLSAIGILLNSIDDNNPASASFCGDKNDPLIVLWTNTPQLCAGLPDGLSRQVVRLLRSSISVAGSSVAAALQTEFDISWQNEVREYFTDHLEGRYPFAETETAAEPEQVSAFFNKAGPLVQFRGRMGPWIARNNHGWHATDDGPLQLRFSDTFFRCLNHAQRIEESFLAPDGTIRPVRAALACVPPTRIAIDDPATDSPSADAQWPAQGRTAAVLHRYARPGVIAAEKSWRGSWALIRMLEEAKAISAGEKMQLGWELGAGTICRMQSLAYSETYAANALPGIGLFGGFNLPTSPFTQNCQP